MTSKQYPDRPIRLVIAASPGSASDILTRTIAPALANQLDAPLEVVPKEGDNGAVGAQFVARSMPDGYTLFMTSLHIHAVGPSLHPNLPYDVRKDFTPLSLVARCPLLLAVHPSVPAHSVDELTRLAIAKPNTLTFASSAVGGSPHLATALYQQMTGVQMKHVCYDRTQELFADLVAGRISLSFNNIMSLLPLLANGTVRGLAVTGPERTPVAAQLPTLAEAGLPGYEVTNWLGIVGPAGLSAHIVATLNTAIARALQAPEIREKLEASGMQLAGSSSTEFATHIEHELTKWAALVKASMTGSVAH